MAQSLAFKNKLRIGSCSPRNSETANELEVLSRNLAKLEQMAEVFVHNKVNQSKTPSTNYECTPDSFKSMDDALIESREGALAKIPKQLPPGRKPPSSFRPSNLQTEQSMVSRKAELEREYLNCSSTIKGHEQSEVLWQATEASPSIASFDLQLTQSRNSVRRTMLEDFSKASLEA